MEIYSWAFVDKNAPPEVREAIRIATIQSFSPSGVLEQDDMDNWQECTQTARGVVSKRYSLISRWVWATNASRRPAGLGQRLWGQRKQPPALLPAVGRADVRRLGNFIGTGPGTGPPPLL